MDNLYQKGKIYKITSPNTDRIYVGSTTYERLCQRLSKHRKHMGEFDNGKGAAITSFEILRAGNAQITLVESYPCRSKDELLARERHWIEHYKDTCVNKNRPIITAEEAKERNKQYRNEHKAEKRDYDKEYRDQNKEKISECRKVYCEKNAEQLKVYHQQKYQRRKEHLAEKIKCECGSEVSRYAMRNHKTTKSHESNLIVALFDELPQGF
jgi:hypothetical protein